jgi:hypothetical protein
MNSIGVRFSEWVVKSIVFFVRVLHHVIVEKSVLKEVTVWSNVSSVVETSVLTGEEVIIGVRTTITVATRVARVCTV